MAPPKSNLAVHIGTNYIPSEEDIAHIKNFILPTPTAKIAELDVEIDRVQKHYLSLTKRRQDLLAEIDGYRNLISPARRLPIDILQEIFIHTLPTTHNALMDPSHCPMLLTQICSRWRSIALSNPRLWSTIHIPMPTISSGFPFWLRSKKFLDFPQEFRTSSLSSFNNYARAIANWLGKSGVSPLSISLHDPRDSSVTKEHYDIILDSILPLASRWKDLVLDTSSPFVSRIAELTESDVPLLESLTLRDMPVSVGDVGSFNDPQLTWNTSGIVKARRLRKIAHTPIKDNFAYYPFKWQQLTDIKISRTEDRRASKTTASVSDLIFVLSLSPRLINFHSELFLLPWDSKFPSTSSILSLPLPNLRKMVFYDAGANCKVLFDLLEVPSLLHLEIFPSGRSGSSILSNFLHQISGTIISLTTSHSFFVKPDHYPVLSQCQKLTSITIKPALSGSILSPPVDYITDFFLGNLTLPTNDPNRLAPALQVFDCQTGGSFSEAAVLKFIKAKQSRADLANLKRISIPLDRPKEIDILLDDDVARYIKDGLVVNLRYPLEPFPNRNRPFMFTADVGIDCDGSSHCEDTPELDV